MFRSCVRLPTVLGALLLILGVSHSETRAQFEVAPISRVYLDGGLLRPVSPDGFTRYWKRGNRIRGGIEWQSPDVFTLRTGLTYSSLLLDRSAVEEDLGGVPADRTFEDFYYVVELAADVLLHAPSPFEKVTPYAVVGIGFQITDVAELPIDREIRREDLAAGAGSGLMIDAGLGIRHRLSPHVDVFAEGLLVGSFTGGNNKAYTPLTVGLAVPL